jgi:hypothetical protein
MINFTLSIYIMTTIHPQYITDQDGNKTAVVLPINEFEQLLEELEELDDIRLYDEAKKDNESSMLLDDYVKQRFAK